MNHALLRLAAAGLVVAAGCTHHGHDPGGFATVEGHVTRSPTCPGPQHEGQVCSAPIAGAEVDAGMARTTTDDKGFYRLGVHYSTVTITIHLPEGITARCTPVTVATEVGKTVTQDIDCDTGIR